MSRIITLMIFIVVFSFAIYSQTRTDNYEDLFLKTNFKEVRKCEKIQGITNAIKRILTNNDRNFIADPDEDFNATDLILNENSPSRRLIFAGKSREFCFIYYEVGGFAYHHAFIMFKVIKKSFIPVLAFSLFRRFESTELIKKYISQNLPLKSYKDFLIEIKNNKTRTKPGIIQENKFEIIKYDVNNFELLKMLL